jgi:hypothetical protein
MTIKTDAPQYGHFFKYAIKCEYKTIIAILTIAGQSFTKCSSECQSYYEQQNI